MNELYTDPELSTLLVWGEEGTDYVTDPDGHIHFPDGVDTRNAEWYHTMNWEMPNQYICPVWVGDSPDLGSKIMEFNAQAETSIALGFTFDNSAYTAEQQHISAHEFSYRYFILTHIIYPPDKNISFSPKTVKSSIEHNQNIL